MRQYWSSMQIDIIFSKIIIWDNSSGYHSAQLWCGENITMETAKIKLTELSFYSNFKLSLEVLYGN